jgi:hypothetical protein
MEACALDVVCVLLLTAKYGLHPAVLDLAMVVGYYRVELTWSLSFLFRHNFAVSSDFIKVLFQFVVPVLLDGG